MEVSPRSSDGDKILIPSKPNLIYESESKEEEDPMVSGAGHPKEVPGPS